MRQPPEPEAGTVLIEMHDATPGGPPGGASEHPARIALLRLNRPRKRNALSTGLEQEIRQALRSPAVRAARAIVLTGDERAFSAGADLGELRSMTPAAIAEYYRASGRVYAEVAALPQPTVAAISGYCLGGGLELALACDSRIAADTARLGFPEIALGILPSSGG
ncbi:enoyl-CoA hydratase/isomerase family protein, partial [Leucobacter sp. M11]|uniref:enoyl-CoA hydratase/isomerase family protein n=1 Tax=Leucobacter sp. M11 TaxID=2993565 RepID=UPI002D7E8110